MKSYDPRQWPRFFIDFHKSDTFVKLLPLMGAVALYSLAIAFLKTNFFDHNSALQHVSVIHTLLGFAISLLLAFRTNTAYDRWWEGRKLWGSLVNNSRNLAIKINSLLPGDESAKLFYQQIIPRFALELKNHLQLEETRYRLDEEPHPEIPDFDRNKHVPNQVNALIMNHIITLQQQGKITEMQLLFLRDEVSSFADICGACERIKNTPIPYSYSAFIKKFILFYTLALPVAYVFTLDYLVVPVVVFVFYVLASLELIAEEIEDPFGKDDNDLPLDKIANNIKKNVEEILA